MTVDEKILDKCISNIIDCISKKWLEQTGIEKIDDVFDRKWLIEWFKHGCPVHQESFYFKTQKIAKIAFEDILSKEEFLVLLDQSDVEVS